MEALWYYLVAVMVAGYATLDGFDFGAGTLHLFVARTDAERRTVLGAIGPLWDGNEVWLLAGGGTLFLAFPHVLASGFSGLYLAMFLVVWTLILRGISIEFRSHVRSELWRAFWDVVFFVASSLMPVFLGAALGNILRGLPVDSSGRFNLPLFTDFRTQNPVGILDWYTVLTGLFVWVTLAAHGALFLSFKCDGPVRERSRRAATYLWAGAAVFGIVTTLATASVNPALYRALPHSPLAWVGLGLFLAGMVTTFVALRLRRDLLAFLGSSGFIVGILVATAACSFPVMLRSTLDPKFSLTAYNASVAEHGLRVGAIWWVLGFLIVLGYFTLLFRLHRGRVKAEADGEGY